MLDIRTRHFKIEDTDRFTMNLASEVAEGMEEMPPLDPDTDARVVEDVLGRIYGILIRVDHELLGKIFMVFIDTDYPEIMNVLMTEHLQRMREEDGR